MTAPEQPLDGSPAVATLMPMNTKEVARAGQQGLRERLGDDQAVREHFAALGRASRDRARIRRMTEARKLAEAAAAAELFRDVVAALTVREPEPMLGNPAHVFSHAATFAEREHPANSTAHTTVAVKRGAQPKVKP